jgi:putative RNA 2'-phosphotransferase
MGPRRLGVSATTAAFEMIVNSWKSLPEAWGVTTDHIQLSRVLSHALRHEPWLYELELDADGWAAVEAVLAALREERPDWRDLAEADIAEMMRRASKQRYEMAGGRIRALYGHSLPGKLNRTPAAPPAELFHGTAPETVDKIRRSGLLPMRRQFVHLSVDRETAHAVGRRKARAPVILSIDAAAAARAGIAFYAGNDKVWLADRIGREFISAER